MTTMTLHGAEDTNSTAMVASTAAAAAAAAISCGQRRQWQIKRRSATIRNNSNSHISWTKSSVLIQQRLIVVVVALLCWTAIISTTGYVLVIPPKRRTAATTTRIRRMMIHPQPHYYYWTRTTSGTTSSSTAMAMMRRILPDGVLSMRTTTTTTTTRLYSSVSHAAQRLQKLIPDTSNILPFTYMAMLAIQFAIQPILTKRYAPKTIERSTYVLAQDVVRMLICGILLKLNQVQIQFSGKFLLMSAGFPALLYLVQSYCSLMAYQNLSPITYNVLNQTKTISGAIFCFILMRQKQTPMQMLALLVLLLSALVMENVITIPEKSSWTSWSSSLWPWLSKKEEESETMTPMTATTTTTTEDDDIDNEASITTSTKQEQQRKNYILSGILPIVIASLLSGLAGAWVQRTLQFHGTNSVWLTLQMSICGFSFMSIITFLFLQPKKQQQEEDGTTTTATTTNDASSSLSSSSRSSWTRGWTWKTWIPIATNAGGGILVGLVTKHCGVVLKGFALIVGMFGSGILQNYLLNLPVSNHQWYGGILAGLSIWMHNRYKPL